ncbi:hypothetical protein ABZ922_15295 [Streptomyces shenzhenensis]|uniref:hypothetical protein n=1 Tax=Streptomyces shenzhenensis TaxID=943815 RepID=UPI0033D3D887
MTSAAEARGPAAGRRAQDAQARAATQRAAWLIRPGMIAGSGNTVGRRPEGLHPESLGATVSLRRENDGSPTRPDHRHSPRDRPPERAAATTCPIESAPSIAGQLTSRPTSTDTEVDGGSHEQTIPMVVDAGADIAVAGSATVDSTRPVPACVTALRDAVARTASSRTTTAGGA